MIPFVRKSVVANALMLGLALAPAAALASEQAGSITQIEGKVQLFTHPTKTLPADTKGSDGSRALFEGEYYLVRDAKLGDRVEQGNILRTPPGAKARVVFENGDQYNVGPGSAYRVSWKKDSSSADAAKPEVNLMYGKLRGVVAKGGPRSKLVVKTPSASMGVRGTDFFIATQDADKGTEVSIIRGAVEVTPIVAKSQTKNQAKPVLVKEGFSAEISAAARPVTPPVTQTEAPAAASGESVMVEPTKLQPVVELRKTTQEDYTGIQKSSEIRQEAAADRMPSDSKVAEKIAELEKKAIETTVADIQKTNPEMLKKIDLKNVTSVAVLHQAAVTQLAETAPKAPTKRKPYKSELEDLEGDAYDKYFKPAIQQ